jgi:hypothetical protein
MYNVVESVFSKLTVEKLGKLIIKLNRKKAETTDEISV